MRDLTLDGIREANALESAFPFIWLYEIQNGTVDPAQMYRLTNYNEQVTHRGNTYDPHSVEMSAITASGRGDLPTIDFVLGNTSLEIAPIMDADDGFIGGCAVVTLINVFEITDDNAGIRFEGEITGSSMTNEGISVSVSARDLYRAKIPPFRYTRRKCRFLLGDGGCGYSLLGSPGFTTCPGYTFEACTLVGLDEAARSLPNNHPKRIGAFPGIPRPRGTL